MADNQYSMAFGDGGGYVMPGDSITADVDGFDVTARLVLDDDASPLDWMDESNPDDAQAIEAWRRGDWQMVGVVVSIGKAGVVLDDHAASLWGIEANYPRPGGRYDNSYLTEVANELLEEALETGQAAPCRLCAAA